MKKRILSICLMMSILLTWFTPISANAAILNGPEASTYNGEVDNSNKMLNQNPNSEGVTIYNGAGQYVGDFQSVEEFESKVLGINKNERGPVVAWIMTAAAVYGAVSMINDASYLLTGIDAKVWIRENVIVPFYDYIRTMRLYSSSGGIDNPYPPHSYQYTQFNRTNYYWVVQ